MAMAPPSVAYSAVSLPARPVAVSSGQLRAAVGAGVVCRASATGTAAKGGDNGKWWAPLLLGWSGRKADYLEAPAPVLAARDEAAARRQFVGVMTEEKARELRARVAQAESFHDAMYHSAIASRLARSA